MTAGGESPLFEINAVPHVSGPTRHTARRTTSDELSGELWDASGFGGHLETRELLLDVAIEAVLGL